MRFYVLTLFPQVLHGALDHSITKRAQEQGLVSINCIDIRDFSGNKHRRVDDYPYGGGAGLVMRPEPVYDSYMSIKDRLKPSAKVVFLTPSGRKFSQKEAEEFAKEDDLVLICGHYEGIDQRVIDEIVTDEISIGDYILTGGEIAAIVLIDAVSRLIPGVLGADESLAFESFTDNLLEYPQYTRPQEFRGRAVPEVLLSGNHKEIEKWRHERALEITKLKRPDL
ncbi:MAG: tRNA (guanosine(37)-N1)-methyltransferase TrmD [Defluviitaleaceae bacterium]|nr:tRNA (guanosine(37)-N1)-methyltransferase TrmD [Defluviitaleaceae bacterium]